ncbi:MAG: hypothetical protein MUC36_22190 [Planctomycetes bacterium]|jgi:hypothetical protein|nr:hypothetical protein [Planctomycetota bacterium]
MTDQSLDPPSGEPGGVAALCVARWNGAVWSAFGTGLSGEVRALTLLPDGRLLAGGSFVLAGGTVVNRLARWNGSSWTGHGAGLNAPVHALAMTAAGTLMVGGDFTTANGNTSAYFPRLATSCPATAVATGVGCAGAGGPNVLGATSLPWIGTSCTAVATGMPSLGLALAVTGFTSQSLPLPAILPAGVAGCTLLVSPDLLEVRVPTAGSVTTAIAIPNTVALATQTFGHQVVPFELDAVGGITAVTSTNALALTIGVF